MTGRSAAQCARVRAWGRVPVGGQAHGRADPEGLAGKGRIVLSDWQKVCGWELNSRNPGKLDQERRAEVKESCQAEI